RLVDGPAVVVEPPGLGEEPAPAQRGDRQPTVADQRGGGGQSVRGDLLTPQPDRRNTGRHAPGDQVGQGPVARGGLVERQPRQTGRCGHSGGTSTRRPSRADRSPASASCTPRAPAHRSSGYGSPRAT